MNLDAKFDSVMQAIINQYSNEIEIRNELVHIYNGNRTYSLGNNETFDGDDIRRIMIQTSNDYFLNEVAGKVGILKILSIDNVENFDEVARLLNDIGRQKGFAEIRNIVNSNAKIVNLLIDGLMDVYHYNKDRYFRNEEEIKLSEQLIEQGSMIHQQEVEERFRASEISAINRDNAIKRLALLDEALEKTKEKGTIGHEGYHQVSYNDNQMVTILGSLVKGNYNLITNNPLNETDNRLRDKLSKVSKEEIFSEVIKNAIRLSSLAKTEKGLLMLYSYGITAEKINMLNYFINNNSITKDNISDIMRDIDIESLTVLLESFIYSRKDQYIKGEILNATMSDQYAALRIEELNKVGGVSLENENNYSK